MLNSALSVFAAYGVLFAATAGAQDLFQSIREGKSSKLEAQLAAGSANPGIRDEFGATPLHYAAAYGTARDVEVLLQAGADPKATTREGSTPLLWATGDRAKVRLLLQAGADVNAKSQSGLTPMLAAAFRNDTEVMRMLAAAGADLKGEVPLFPKLPLRVGLQHLAFLTNDRSLRTLLLEEWKVARPESPQRLVLVPGTQPLAGPFTLTSFSMRHPGTPGIASAVDAMLQLGADPAADIRQLARALPPVAVAASFSDSEAVQLLLKKGGDPNRAGTLGITPLMIAVSTEDPSLAAVRALVEAGAKLDVRDKQGRTALDWALLQGESPVTAYLREAGAVKGEYRDPALPAGTPRSTREAVEVALRMLGASALEFHKRANCISCHQQSLPAVAMSHAMRRGVPVDAKVAEHPTAATMQMWAPGRESFLAGHCAIPGFLGNVTYGLWGMTEEGRKPNAITDAAVTCLRSLQWSDGRWQGADLRPPLAGRLPLVYTALAVQALQHWAPGDRARVDEQIARARGFLQTAEPSDTQGEAFRLLGLVWSGAPAQEIAKRAKALAALQRKDGGWSQRPAMAPDAYATGQAMYALQVSGMRSSSGALQRGARYLLQTQLADGTWRLPTRTLGFQPFIDSGFPHGRDQFISAAATAWAAIALGRTL